jgi:hypothetical protein
MMIAAALLAAASRPAGAAEPKPEDWIMHPADPARFSGGLTRQGDVVDQERFGGKPSDQAFGAFQRGLYKTAYNLALPLAENGNAASQTLVAEILSRGLGMKRDEAAAAKWYERASEQGVPEAQFQYALLLLDGRLVKKDEKQAFALMQAAAEAGNLLAQFNFAQLLVKEDADGRGLEKAVPYYRKAADGGVADAQYAMAQILSNGIGGKTDDVEARHLLLLAARQNFDTAQLDLGRWMMRGKGGEKSRKNEQDGFGWLLRAARGGNVAAQNEVARLYMQGIGVEPDTKAAASWYMLARRAGFMDPIMEDFLDGLTDEEIKQALEASNRL